MKSLESLSKSIHANETSIKSHSTKKNTACDTTEPDSLADRQQSINSQTKSILQVESSEQQPYLKHVKETTKSEESKDILSVNNSDISTETNINTKFYC